MLCRDNPQIQIMKGKAFCPNETATLVKNELFLEMINVLKNEFKRFNPANHMDFDKYFEIVICEYRNQQKINTRKEEKIHEFVNFLSKIQETLEFKLGKDDPFLKECNRTIRNFLLKLVDIDFTEF